MSTDSAAKIKAMRLSYLCFACSSFVIGGAMLLDPIGFWARFDLHVGEPVVATVYGAGIVGEGLVCAWGWLHPLRASAVLLYMVSYKTVVVLALVPRLLGMPEPPWAGWLVVAAWGFVAVWAALLFPWRGPEA